MSMTSPTTTVFLIADADESWILETMGRDWVARRVTDLGVDLERADHPEDLGPGLRRSHRWNRCGAPVDGNPCSRGSPTRANDSVRPRRPWPRPRPGDRQARVRRGCAATAASPRTGRPPIRSSARTSVCTPVRPSALQPDDWVLVVRLGSDGATACDRHRRPRTSTFKPVWVDTGLPDLGPRPRVVRCAHPVVASRTAASRHVGRLPPPPRRLPRRPRSAAAGVRRGGSHRPGAGGRPGRRNGHGLRAHGRRGTAVDRADQRSGAESRLGRWRTAAHRRAWDSNDRAARLPEEGGGLMRPLSPEPLPRAICGPPRPGGSNVTRGGDPAASPGLSDDTPPRRCRRHPVG